MTTADKLAARIDDYLKLGGLFNPEMMKPKAVRDLLIDFRAELQQAQGRLTEEQVLAAIHEADGDYDPGKYAYMDWAKLVALLSVTTPAEPDRITISKEHFNKLCQMAADKKYGTLAERERIRAAIIHDQATSAGDYSEAEEYADRIVSAPTKAEPKGNE